ncbi:MAG: hypothetical protein U5K79_21485 [Cyclobacteriaceae bacterium]|nr:hypothetical protein [Cyclobacteriaceae bacterium]
MRTLLLGIIFTGVTFLQGYSQCSNPYYQLKNGTFIATENYDEKDKLQGRAETRVIELNETPGGYVATINYKVFDKKDKVVSEGNYQCECDDGNIRIDMKAFIPQESLQAYKDMEVEIVSDELQIPANLSVGQTLPDATFAIKTKNSPMPMNMTFNMINRKVEGEESVTTPAGTFDCMKITYDVQSKMMMMNMNMKTVQYLSKNGGAVRTESYKQNGSMLGYTIMTKIEN